MSEKKEVQMYSTNVYVSYNVAWVSYKNITHHI